MAKNSQPKLRHYILLSYGIKMPMKKEGKDSTVAKLEGLWWVESEKSPLEVPREEWQWKLLIRMPDFVTSEIVEKAKKEVFKRKSIDLVKEINLEAKKCNMKTSLKN